MSPYFSSCGDLPYLLTQLHDGSWLVTMSAALFWPWLLKL